MANFKYISLILLISYIYYVNAALLKSVDNLSSDAQEAADTLRKTFNQDNILNSLTNDNASLIPLLANIDNKYNIIYEFGKFLKQASVLFSQTSDFTNQLGEKLKNDGLSESELLALDKTIRSLLEKLNYTFNPNIAQSFSPIISPKIELPNNKPNDADYKMTLNPLERLMQDFNKIITLISGKDVNLSSFPKPEDFSNVGVQKTIEILKHLSKSFIMENRKKDQTN